MYMHVHVHHMHVYTSHAHACLHTHTLTHTYMYGMISNFLCVQDCYLARTIMQRRLRVHVVQFGGGPKISQIDTHKLDISMYIERTMSYYISSTKIACSDRDR